MASPVWMGGGRSRGGGRRPRRAFAAAAAALASVATVAVAVVAAAASVRAAPGGGGGGGAAPPAFHEAAVTGRAANASADPVTAAWVAKLREAAAAALPPLPTADLFRRHEGLFTLHAGIGLAAGQVLLEVGKAQLDAPFGLAIEFSAISKAAATEGVPSRFNLLLISPERLYCTRSASPGTRPPRRSSCTAHR